MYPLVCTPWWVHFPITLVYTGTTSYTLRNQELPACFFHRSLSQLVTYTGAKPWTNDASLMCCAPGSKNVYFNITEGWAAYINPQTGVGLGVYSPRSYMLTGYRVGPDGSTARSDCSYLAPLVRLALTPGKTYTYDCYFVVGTVEQMRSTFNGLHA